METVQTITTEDVFVLYGCCNIRDGDVIDRIGIYADVLEEGEGLIEYALYQQVNRHSVNLGV